MMTIEYGALTARERRTSCKSEKSENLVCHRFVKEGCVRGRLHLVSQNTTKGTEKTGAYFSKCYDIGAYQPGLIF